MKHEQEGEFLTFLVLDGDTEGGLVTPMSTHFRRRPVDHKATNLVRLCPEADIEASSCVFVSLASDERKKGSIQKHLSGGTA